MALDIQGDISFFCESELKFIKNTLLKQGFQNNTVKVEQLSQIDNVMAMVQRITVEENGGNPFKMIVKICEKNEFAKKTFLVDLYFGNEVVMYLEILPAYYELLAEAGLSKKEWHLAPECYGGFHQDDSGILLLEDLQVSDYKMLNRMKPLTKDIIQLVLKQLAKLHALSFALKSKKPELFRRLKKKTCDDWARLNSSEYFKALTKTLEDDIVSLFDNDKYRSVLKGSISNMSSSAVELHDNGADEQYLVIQHGDCWTNNFMFKSENGTPKSCYIIDYQLIGVTYLPIDLLFLLFISTEYEFRRKHYHELLDFYYQNLIKYLSDLRLPGLDCYPRSRLDEDIKKCGKFTFNLCVHMGCFIFRGSGESVQPSDDIKEFANNARMSRLSKETVKTYKKFVSGMVDSFTELGLM